MTEASVHPFAVLTPDFLLAAVEARGLACDRRLTALNSYENRVYQVGIANGEPLIAKFYRPGRWSDAQITEEHDFCAELAALELPVVAPLPAADGATLHHYQGLRFALFPGRGGRAPALDCPNTLVTLGRIHSVGAVRPFRHRERLDVHNRGHDSIELIATDFIPDGLRPAYAAVAREVLARVAALAEPPLRLV